MISLAPGVYERTLLVDVDGSRHDAPGVTWIQGPTLYVDLRLVAGEPIEGFAGRLTYADGIFEWHRDVDLGPERDSADAGTLDWNGDVLIERGAHAPYVEHWIRRPGVSDGWAGLLTNDSGAHAVVVCAGGRFGFAARTGTESVVAMGSAETWRVDTTSTPALLDTALDLTVWTTTETEGNYPQ